MSERRGAEPRLRPDDTSYRTQQRKQWPETLKEGFGVVGASVGTAAGGIASVLGASAQAALWIGLAVGAPASLAAKHVGGTLAGVVRARAEAAGAGDAAQASPAGGAPASVGEIRGVVRGVSARVRDAAAALDEAKDAAGRLLSGVQGVTDGSTNLHVSDLQSALGRIESTLGELKGEVSGAAESADEWADGL